MCYTPRGEFLLAMTAATPTRHLVPKVGLSEGDTFVVTAKEPCPLPRKIFVW